MNIEDIDTQEEGTNTSQVNKINKISSNNTSISNSISALEQCGSWLLSIPRDNVVLLQSTPEYKNFLESFERLGNAHRYQIKLHQQSNENISNRASDGKSSEYNASNNAARNSKRTNNSFSFLQHVVVDDVIMRIFEFLECHTLVQLTTTCHRFCSLSLRSAEHRIQHFFGPPSFTSMPHPTPSCKGRCNAGCTVSASSKAPCFCHYRTTVMQLARAKEQILGIRPTMPPFVSVPISGLPRRIEVTRAGDPEFNGIYFCTGANGNGFLFTKPRITHFPNSDSHSSILFLRCIISKRFSNDSIFWYMSKEITAIENANINVTPDVACVLNRFDLNVIDAVINGNGNTYSNIFALNQEKTQIFSYWVELMRSGEASTDICRYPSQTSILSRNGDPAWQTLGYTADSNPPVVELLD